MHHMRRKLVLITLWIAVTPAWVVAQVAERADARKVPVAPPAAAAVPLDPSDILALIDRLSSSNYEQREAADAALRAIGAQAVPYLSQRYDQADDFETRVRIQRIAERSYFWDRVLGRNGFLGIQHRLYRQPGDPRIDEGTAAFEIARVIEDTSAARAGLQDGDLIVAIDGIKLPADASTNDFAEQIRYKVPGTPMTLEIYRGNEHIELTLAIGHRPQRYYGGAATPNLNAQYDEAVEGFPAWWASRFGAAPVTTEQEYLPLDRAWPEVHQDASPSESRQP